MKIAVLGKGTAGTIAGVHLSKNIPESHVDLIYDPDIPTIGVGEGAGPRFHSWLKSLNIDELLIYEDLFATRKYGILFENWGKTKKSLVHHFNPKQKAYSYHFDASKIFPFLNQFVRLNIIESNISHINRPRDSTSQSEITLSNNSKLYYDYIIDARGFKADNHSNIKLDKKTLLLSDSAELIQIDLPSNISHQIEVLQGEHKHTYDTLTRAIAMKNGWIFVIPLQNRISIGYIYCSKYSNKEEIYSELVKYKRSLLPEYPISRNRSIRFSSYSSSCYSNGNIFYIGNRAAFAEPLEATSIEFILHEVFELTDLILNLGKYKDLNSMDSSKKFNSIMDISMQKIALFISWHYSNGSIYQSKFWDASKEHHQKLMYELDEQVIYEFKENIKSLNSSVNKTLPAFFGWKHNSFSEIESIIS